MQVQEIDPSDLEIDPVNERNENVGPHKNDNSHAEGNSLEESIREQGVIQPPVARIDNGKYKVVVGQRRVLAAQSVGLDNIPIIIVDWDEEEALQATITENIDVFRKSVSRSDRAAAIRKLMEVNEWDVQDVSNELGVAEWTVKDWIERTLDEWEETVVHVGPESDKSEEKSTKIDTNVSESTQSNTTVELDKEDLENISDTDLRTIRTATDSPDERERVTTKVVQEELTQREVREAKKRAERGEGSLEEVIDKISKESQETTGEMKVRTEVVFTGDYAEGLQSAARDIGTSEEELIRQAIGDYLSDEGYL